MNPGDRLQSFIDYMTIWEQLDLEYRRTPEWRFIRKFVLLNRMGKLTKHYERWLNSWLKNSDTR